MTDDSRVWCAFIETVQNLEALMLRARAMAAEDRQRDLLMALNRLELACLELPDVSPDNKNGDSPNSYEARRAQVERAFPELGLYHNVRPSPVLETAELVVCDAVDDLADILRDIDDALWEASTHGRDNGIWQAKFNYENHLGSHLADLRSHIYRLRFFGP